MPRMTVLQWELDRLFRAFPVTSSWCRGTTYDAPLPAGVLARCVGPKNSPAYRLEFGDDLEHRMARLASQGTGLSTCPENLAAHEFGHAVERVLRSRIPGFDARLTAMMPCGSWVSRYAGTSASECWAENFVLYWQGRPMNRRYREFIGDSLATLREGGDL